MKSSLIFRIAFPFILFFGLEGCSYASISRSDCKQINLSSVGLINIKQERIDGIAHGSSHSMPSLSDLIIISPSPKSNNALISSIEKIIVGFDPAYDSNASAQCKENKTDYFYDPNKVICSQSLSKSSLGLIVHFRKGADVGQNGFSGFLKLTNELADDFNENALCSD